MADPVPAPVKPGWQTTEFWLSAVMAVAPMIMTFVGALPPPYGPIIAAVVTAIYTIGRSFVKGAPATTP